jgi:hypothetical protein
MRRLVTLLTLILVVAACRASAAEHKLFAWRVAGARRRSLLMFYFDGYQKEMAARR